MAEFIVRRATPGDLLAILAVEKAWPEDQRAPRAAFEARLRVFPEGVFVSQVGDQVVGVTTSCLTVYSPSRVASLKSWDEVTNGGMLRQPTGKENALYIVSSGIIPEHRRTGIREAHLRAQLTLGRELDLKFVLTGAMLPGYDAYCQEHGELSASDYAQLRRDGAPVDPTVRKLEAVGLKLPGADHVIDDYYPSPPSRNYGVLLVARL